MDLASDYVPAFGKMPPAYVLANVIWTVGALVLIFPPLLTGFELLVVLEVFLVMSGVMSFWQPDHLALKILSRISLSLMVVGYIKWRGMLPGVSYPWSLLSPRFYSQAFATGDNRALAVGLEMLGVGYALGSVLMLTIGSLYLVRSSYAEWRRTEHPIFIAWMVVNVVYVTAGSAVVISNFIR